MNWHTPNPNDKPTTPQIPAALTASLLLALITALTWALTQGH